MRQTIEFVGRLTFRTGPSAHKTAAATTKRLFDEIGRDIYDVLQPVASRAACTTFGQDLIRHPLAHQLWVKTLAANDTR